MGVSILHSKKVCGAGENRTDDRTFVPKTLQWSRPTHQNTWNKHVISTTVTFILHCGEKSVSNAYYI